MSSSTAKTPESNTECSQDSRSPGLQHTPLQAELTASLLFKQPSTPNTHTRLLPAMLLLAMLLAAQMPAMVKSRSIPSSAHLIVDQGREDEVQRSLTQSEERAKRGVNDPTLWPNKTVPFVFKAPFSTKNKMRVLAAMNVWEENSCIKFVERTNEEFFAQFEINSYTCESLIGMKEYSIYQNKGQPVKLTTSCLKHHPSLLHELGHLIGFYHEHQRPDRDDYVQIHSQNLVKSKYSLQFQKYDFETYGPYDLGSIMHYSLDHFAKFGTHTIQVLPGVTIPEGVTIGHVATISELDAEKARLMYQCSNDTLQEPDAEDEPDEDIYAGEQVALSVKGMAGITNFSANSWLSCTQQTCKVDHCPGKSLEGSDMEACPFNTFTLHKLHVGAKSEPSSAIIRVGDAIVLEHRTPATPTTTAATTTDSLITTAASTGAPETDGAPQQQQEEDEQEKSFFVSCDPYTQVCSLSLECTANISDYNTTSLCQQNVLIVRAEGKEDGTPITSHDLIGFEFMLDDVHHDSFFSQRCAFGCDSVTGLCSKELCIFAKSNSLEDSVSDATDSGEVPKCGKDLFLIQKF